MGCEPLKPAALASNEKIVANLPEWLIRKTEPAPFAPVGEVQPVDLPVGEVAVTTHWGDYSRLGAAHSAVIEWCRSQGHRLSGTRWEVYGHWTDDPSKLRTDVYYLLA